MVSSISSSTDSLTALQQLLKEADTDGDAVVSKSELTTALSSDSDAAAQLVAAADSDGDGAMSLSEFASFAEKFSTETGMALLSAQESMSGLTAMFTSADTDGSATVTASELATLLTAATETEEETAGTETEEEAEAAETSTASASTATGISVTTDVEDLLNSVDATGDGVFNRDDVAKMLLDAEQEAARRKQESGTEQDTRLFTAATSALDTDKDGVVSDEEKAVYG